MIRRLAAGAAAVALVAAGSLALAPAAQASGTSTSLGTTTVTLTDAALGALGPLSPSAVAPGTLGATPAGVQAAFPITGVKNGDILHRGGLQLTNGKIRLALTNYTIDTDRGVLTARASINGFPLLRIPLFNVALDTTPVAGCDASADLTLTRTASTVLRIVYGTPNLTGAPIGKACVDLA